MLPKGQVQELNNKQVLGMLVQISTKDTDNMNIGLEGTSPELMAEDLHCLWIIQKIELN